MFAAVLMLCSLASTDCKVIGTDPIFPTASACQADAANFLIANADNIRGLLGPYAVNLWCREVLPGKPA